ncbi:glycosyltransferase family 2 protein [Streptosporangium carneum]|uniref:Glycosyl transferase n=1 Tax=Streptosporangium carneum TaxID=47481 RepID=A0A9W6HVA9_9ACTN|nr:glycosyltransferase family 2 protein [Streptosporangium carneum]GLK06990.1 glycosyl transferase [Streptosporangium carneum]
MPRPGITAMIPCYNEIDCVERAYREIRAELVKYEDVELLFVDDGSTDGTLEAIKGFAAEDPLVKYISFARNFGLEAAFSAGFKYASKMWTVQFDADLQSPPHEVHRLVEKALEGYDVVFAVRENRQDPWHRRLGTWAHQTIARRWLGIELPQGASVFRIVRTSVAHKVVDSRLSTPYFIATAPLLGARYTTLPTAHHPRLDGTGKWNLRKLFSHAIELFVGFSFRPLTWLIGLAGAVLAAGAATMALTLAGRLGPVAVELAGLAAALVTLALLLVVARYLVRVMRVQAIGVPRYQIREANIPIRADEALYGYETPHVVGQFREPEVWEDAS